MKKSQIVILLVLLALVASTLACGSSAPAGVSNIALSTDKEGANKSTTFAPSDTIYLTADVNGVEAGTNFDIKWYVLDVAGQDPATPFVTSSVAWASGMNKLYANINSTSGGFPAGNYKVEIYMAGTKVGEQTFAIQ